MVIRKSLLNFSSHFQLHYIRCLHKYLHYIMYSQMDGDLS
jgi:hypothetical protein